MNPNIRISHDSKRLCGWRTKVGSTYFRLDGQGMSCGVLPLELKPCPVCESMGVKCHVAQTRGWTWIDPSKLFDWKSIKCYRDRVPYELGERLCGDCAMSKLSRMNHVGLLWVGRKPYATPNLFDKESIEQGISRRVPHSHIPRGFEIGKDWILLAHADAVLKPFTEDGMANYAPGVFRAFCPDRIEVLCDGTESDETIEDYLKRGLTPVIIERKD